MIIYILMLCSFITIFAFHIPSRNFNGHFAHEYVPNGRPPRLNFGPLSVNLINNDDEFEGIIGYEAAEKVKEKIPNSVRNISKSMIRSILDHDLRIINEQSGDQKPKWRIRNDKQRFDLCYYKEGQRVLGRVAKVYPTYALVDIGSTKYGVLHARDMSRGWVDRVDLTLTPTEDIHVYIKSINHQYNTVKLSLIPPPESEDNDSSNPQEEQATERRSLTTYQIEELVDGVIVRISPLGYYVDIGAKVDAFLHINDIKVTDKMRKSYTGTTRFRDRNKYKIGGKLDQLFIKSIDLIKNRIGLSENTLLEELERNVMTGRETPEQQSAYLRNYNLDMMKDLRVNEIGLLKLIGGYDEYLEKLNASRNASIDYLLYLENLQEQKELEGKQKNLFHDLSSKSKINQDKDRFNKLAHKIVDLSNCAYRPPDDEKSIYKYADSRIWEPRIYTRFEPTAEPEAFNSPAHRTDSKQPSTNQSDEAKKYAQVNRVYFKKLADEITEGLRDVQGESFNLAEKYKKVNQYEDPHKMINYLYDQFHLKPSNISVQKDKYERQRGYVHSPWTSESDPGSLSEPGPSDERSSVLWKENLEMRERQDAARHKMVKELLSTGDPDEAELAQMLIETKDYNPFEHCNTIAESEESSIKGASNLFKDDVLQWNERVHNMIMDDKISIPQELQDDSPTVISQPDTQSALDGDDDIENIDPDVLKALDDTDRGVFTEPIIEDHMKDSIRDAEYIEDVDLGDADVDFYEDPRLNGDDTEFPQLSESCPTRRDKKRFPNSDSEQPISKLPVNKLEFASPPCPGTNLASPEHNNPGTPKLTAGTPQDLDPETMPNPKLERINVKKLVKTLRRNQKLGRDLLRKDAPITAELFKSHSPADPAPEISGTQIDSKVQTMVREIKRVIYKMTDSQPPEEAPGDTTLLEPPRREPPTLESSFHDTITPEQDELSDFIARKLDQTRPVDEHPGSIRQLFADKRDLKELVKYAREHLTANDLEVVQRFTEEGNNEYEEERVARILGSAFQKAPKKTKYTYYREGYDKFLAEQRELEANATPGPHTDREMRVKLSVLLRNKNFINMLKRLDVDPNKLTPENITQLLPQQFQQKRLTPSSDQVHGPP